MSGKMAASALLNNDQDVNARLAALNERAPLGVTRVDWVEFVRYLNGLWTLTLAADAASVSEEQVTAAMLTWFSKAGSSATCRDIVKEAQT
jgi:predicted Abi (CAAX) family protease